MGMLLTSRVFSSAGNRQALDRFAGRSDDRGLGERPGQEPGRRPHVVAEDLRGDERGQQARDAQDDGERDLGQGVLLQAPEELRADLVSGREQEQVEEDGFDERRDLDVELARRARPPAACRPPCLARSSRS